MTQALSETGSRTVTGMSCDAPDPVLSVDNLSKVYRIYRRPVDRLLEMFTPKKRHIDYPALRSISFSLHEGQSLGIVGDNGAGKSTLLHLLAGTLAPTSGEIKRRGSIGLLELGLGIHEEFTGRENIFLYADLLGMSRRFVRSKFDEIVDFAELGPFIDRPVQTYSTGMKMRLAFSLVSSLEPDILIIDEALAVGDIHFQKKCIDRITDFQKKGKSLLLCSHSVYHINRLCGQTLWLQEGRMKMLGDTREVMPLYEAYQLGKNGHVHPGSKPEQIPGAPVYIKECTCLNNPPIHPGDDLAFFLVVESAQEQLPYHITLSIKLENGLGVYVAGTHLTGHPPIRGRRREISIVFPKVPLMAGQYTPHVRIFDDRGLMVYHEKVLPPFRVAKDGGDLGICRLNHRWEIR